MGLLGTIFTARSKRKRNKEADKLRRIMKERIGTQAALVDIKQSFEQASLRDALFDSGREGSTLDARLQRQLDLKHADEDLGVNEALQRNTLQELDNKVQATQDNLAIVDAIIATVAGGVVAAEKGGSFFEGALRGALGIPISETPATPQTQPSVVQQPQQPQQQQQPQALAEGALPTTIRDFGGQISATPRAAGFDPGFTQARGFASGIGSAREFIPAERVR